MSMTDAERAVIQQSIGYLQSIATYTRPTPPIAIQPAVNVNVVSTGYGSYVLYNNILYSVQNPYKLEADPWICVQVSLDQVTQVSGYINYAMYQQMSIIAQDDALKLQEAYDAANPPPPPPPPVDDGSGDGSGDAGNTDPLPDDGSGTLPPDDGGQGDDTSGQGVTEGAQP